jgi:hypothetical protein
VNDEHQPPTGRAVEPEARRVRRTAVRRTRVATAAFVPVALLGMSGCSMDFASMAPDVAAIRQSQDADRPAEQKSIEATPASDLASGSTRHVRRISEMSVVLDYWTEHADDVREGESAAVSLAVGVERSNENAGEITITHVELVGDRGEVLVSDTGEFVVTPPFSYQTEFVTPSSTKTEQEVRARIDLLVETEPHSGTFFRRTVIDTLRLTTAGV